MLTEQEWLGLIDVRRNDWDYDEVRAKSTRTWEQGIDHCEWHHTGGRGPRNLSFEEKRIWLLSIERYHELTKGWSDIFYHLFVFADGEIWEGRQPLRTSQANISEAFTVHIPGNDTGVTDVQLASLLKVSHAITDGDPNKLRDHQSRPASTSCCGDKNRIALEKVRGMMPHYKENTMTTLADNSELMVWAQKEVPRFFAGGDIAVLSSADHPADYSTQLLLTILGRTVDMLRAEIAAEGCDCEGHVAEAGPAGPAGPQGEAGPEGPAGATGADGAGADIDADAIAATVYDIVLNRLRTAEINFSQKGSINI